MEEQKEVKKEAVGGQPQEPVKKQRRFAKKGKSAAVAAVCALLVGGMAASVGMNGCLMNQMSAQRADSAVMTKFIEDERARQAKEAEQENSYQEDGYKVMEQYEIISTKQISDAYLNGDPSGLDDEDQQTYEMASKVLDEIIKDGMSDYEKELAIYDWMVENIGQGSGQVISLPGQNNEAYTPYMVLSSKTAVCVGYATTFRLLANMVGLDVHIVHNDYHSWDMVKLDDGEWYQLDVYSDVNGARYRNFNMTDAMARSGHDWDGSSLPEAKGTKYSYAAQNAVAVKDLFEIPEKVRAGFDKKESSSMYFKFPKMLTDAELALANQMISVIQQAMYSLPGAESMDVQASWVDDGEGKYVLAVYINNYASVDTSIGDADPAKVTEMTNKINELFGSQVMDPTTIVTDTPAADTADAAAAIGEVSDAGESADAAVKSVIGGADGPTVTFSTESAETKQTAEQ